MVFSKLFDFQDTFIVVLPLGLLHLNQFFFYAEELVLVTLHRRSIELRLLVHLQALLLCALGCLVSRGLGLAVVHQDVVGVTDQGDRG